MLEDKNQSRTSLGQLGEFGLINHITKHFKVSNKSTVKAVGDDAAVLEKTDRQTIITTDLLVEGVHFDLSYVPLKHLGYKSSVDFVSNNGILASSRLYLKAHTPVELLVGFSLGIVCQATFLPNS